MHTINVKNTQEIV